MGRQQSRRRRHPRPVPIEYFSTRRTSHPDSGGSPRARTKARATRTVTDEFVRLNFHKRKAAFGHKGRFFHALKVLRKLA
jgi:hypothetical protein